MALTNRVFPPYQFQEYPKHIGDKLAYNKKEEEEFLEEIELAKEADKEPEEEDEGLDKEALQNQADELGIKWKNNWSANRLKKAIEAAQEG